MATKTKERPLALETEPNSRSGNGAAPLSPEILKRLYSYMLKCRTVEEKARTLFKQGRYSGNYYPAVGQEATTVGTTIDLEEADYIAPSHRDFSSHILKGTPLKFLYAQLYARKTSPDQGRSSPAHCGYAPLNVITPSSTIAAQLNIGTGIAHAYKMQKKPNIVMALSGDGSTSLGFWHEALNFAGVYKLPIVYIVQNNLWAESVSLKQQTAVEDLSIKAQAYGFPGITVDGNDVVAVYRVAREAIHRARTGGGPTLIECKTYRWYGHSMIDPGTYRPPEEIEYWKSRDPIPFMERYLAKHNLWSDSWKEELLQQFNQEIDEAVEFAEKSPYAEPEECLDHVYSFSIRERELNRKTWTSSATTPANK
ncbi:MAG TPA: thiamine pyrophosphate-dependent dehydrogenase E1 component subunit alpha [Terriglobales bacterium]|jgi:TPP-dependent pyruvate/acetoin dehydrogenase alpha subunit|nr:thiamine pyrophosphate-dependent dehydrogenase E1 component subunit alpha [Terriglobales bacterium]